MPRRPVLLSATAVAALLALIPIPVGAHDHRPPEAELRFGRLLQEGRLVSYHWSSKTEDGCISSLVVANPSYPRPGLPVGPGRFRAALRLSRPDRPTRIRVVAWEANPADRQEPGRRADVAVSLRPREPKGEVVGWAAMLGARVERDLYLRVTGAWEDRQGCHGPQRATWLFHVAAG
jgi:hypothetical protein